MSQNKTGEDLHVAGASIPSVPGVIVGRNEDLAWGVSTARLDLSDAYIEKLNPDGDAIRYKGDTVDIIKKGSNSTCPIRGFETRTFEWVPHHGPIISQNEDEQRAVTVRWTARAATAGGTPVF